jgi:hypothetical protein
MQEAYCLLIVIIIIWLFISSNLEIPIGFNLGSLITATKNYS